MEGRESCIHVNVLESYKICKSANQAYKQFGNSVVIDVLQLIAKEIGTVMEGK